MGILVASIAVLGLVARVMGHGFLATPPSRNNMWRLGFDTPKNYNDMGLNCGGASNQWETHHGKCGLCGDPYQGPRDHEVGGQYVRVNRPIGRCYNAADKNIDIKVTVTAHHEGYFEFRLCENNNMAADPGQHCLDTGHLLTVAGTSGDTRYYITGGTTGDYEYQLDMPNDVRCTQCILQWKYNAGNSYGCDDTGCGIGLGAQEQFINCADIAILQDCGAPPPTNEPRTDPPTDKPATNKPVTNTAWPATDKPATAKPITTTEGTTSPGTCSTGGGTWKGMEKIVEWCNMNCFNP